MKNLITLVLVMCSYVAFAQGSTKNDIIITKNGELIQAKVVKVSSSTVSFNYPGETVINEVEKNTLEKIVFASGRTQSFGDTSSAPSKSGETVFVPAEKSKPIPKEEIFLNQSVETGSLAIIPASFNKNGTYSKEFSSELSNYVAGYLAKKSAVHGLQVQDMTKTIRSLVDNGIGYQELKSASMRQLRDAVGTEFLLSIEVNEGQGERKTNFFGEMEESATGKTKTAAVLTVYETNTEKEIHSASASYEQGNTNAPSTDKNWQSLVDYMVDQFIRAKSL